MPIKFIKDLHEELELACQPEHDSEARLAGWLTRNLLDPYTDQACLMVFICAWLGSLMAGNAVSLHTAKRLKFKLRSLLEKRLRRMRTAAKQQAFQLTLFSDGKEERVKVGGDYEYEFHPDHYSPGSIFSRGGEMRHHYYPQVGDFDSGEEEACAWYLDDLCEAGRLQFWVRNLTRKGSASFFLQKATDRFYPDFIAKLPDGRLLLVEYKGADRWDGAADDRAIGALWEDMSGGRGLFVMVTAKRFEMIDAKLETPIP